MGMVEIAIVLAVISVVASSGPGETAGNIQQTFNEKRTIFIQK